MLKIEDKYIGSVFHKYETLNMRKVVTWYFGSSVFYGMLLKLVICLQIKHICSHDIVQHHR